MGLIAKKFAAKVYVTDDNPRNENPDEIIKDIIQGLKENKHKIIKNRKDAILEAIKISTNNIVAILGKGIEEYQIFKNKKIPHSDIAIIRII